MMMRRYLGYLLWQPWLALLLIVPVTTQGQEPEESAAVAVAVGETAPDFTLKSAAGEPFTLSQCQAGDGKYVVAVFVRAHW